MYPDPRQKSGAVKQTIGRAIAFFIGSFSILNILGQFRVEGFDANSWWIDFGSIKQPIASSLLAVISILLITFALIPGMPRRLRGIMDGLLLFLLAVCIYNVCTFYHLLKVETIRSDFPIPFSLLVALGIIIVICTSNNRLDRHKRMRRGMTFFAVLILCMVLFPLAQMYCFGKTDYRRSADLIVVFGAGVDEKGNMSDALTDRTVTGCNLYLEGYASRIIFSGGPGPGSVHETEAMKRKAMKMGVPENAIILDTEGLSTQKTVENTTKICTELFCEKILAVSHFYHLPRIKMTYQRQQTQVFTVPAEEKYTLIKLPFYLAREVAALWVYYLRPLAPTP